MNSGIDKPTSSRGKAAGPMNPRGRRRGLLIGMLLAAALAFSSCHKERAEEKQVPENPGEVSGQAQAQDPAAKAREPKPGPAATDQAPAAAEAPVPGGPAQGEKVVLWSMEQDPRFSPNPPEPEAAPAPLDQDLPPVPPRTGPRRAAAITLLYSTAVQGELEPCG